MPDLNVWKCVLYVLFFSLPILLLASLSIIITSFSYIRMEGIDYEHHFTNAMNWSDDDIATFLDNITMGNKQTLLWYLVLASGFVDNANIKPPPVHSQKTMILLKQQSIE